jgi:hypothetical protein
VVCHFQQIAGEADQILEPYWLELDFRAQFPQLGGHFLVEEVIARDDGDGHMALFGICPKPPQKAKAVHERHPEIEDDGVGVVRGSFPESHFAVQGGAHMEPFELQHPCKSRGYSLIVVDNEDGRRSAFRLEGWHALILTDQAL